MIKRLQRKFVMITALSVAIVMIVLLAGINAANMIQTEQDSDTILRMLSDNDGRFPDNKDSMKVKTGNPQQDNPQQDNPQQDSPQQGDAWQKTAADREHLRPLRLSSVRAISLYILKMTAPVI